MAVEPSVEGVRVDLVGGDAFLRVRVEPGRGVEIPGYEGEPYLRVDATGVVSRNARSPATWLNSPRYGPASVAPTDVDVDVEAAPEWRPVADGGRYVWHDHRIAAMGGPPQRTREVPLVLDGVPVRVLGELRPIEPPDPWPWRLLGAAVAVAGLAMLAWRIRLGALAVGAVAVAAAVVGVAELRALPGEAGPRAVALALPAVALVCAGASSVRRGWAAPPLVAGAGIALVVWGWPRRGVLDRAVLLTALPDVVERAVGAAALGLGLAATVAGVLGSVLGPTRHLDRGDAGVTRRRRRPQRSPG